ncbi:zinc finger protein [Stylonychia lemnae]|uniref:Zinc finger protein n=1 Tax=Stylonychia lemnae TaxID=5949 RepID=A0A077ZRE3_STYLE|nr:zinc finger protein [Stylonychia lemnae]|eukprot:CDW71071.1 zinc finger protein [Stylonychia lemnae]
MSNVLKQFLGQLARPSQASLYAQNDMVAQALIQIFTNNHHGTQPQSLHQPSHLPHQLSPAYSTDSKASQLYLKSQQQMSSQGMKIGVQQTPVWIQREQFMMKAHENEILEQFEEEQNQTENLDGQNVAQEQQSVSSLKLGLPRDQSFIYPFRQVGMSQMGFPLDFNQNQASENEIADSKQTQGQIYSADQSDQRYSPNQYGTPDYEYTDNQDQQHYQEMIDLSIKKPKRVFNNKEDQVRYIEGFRTKYKTEICKNWELTGFCQFESSCSFAHGQHELNTKQNIPKNYKTKLCKRFHEEFYCPYGPRCQFKHQNDDLPNRNDYHNLNGQQKSNQTLKTQQSNADQSKAAQTQYDLNDMRLLHEALTKELKTSKSFKIGQITSEDNAVSAADADFFGIESNLNEKNSTLLPNLMSRKRLQIFEKITLTKSSKRKNKKGGAKAENAVHAQALKTKL